MLYAKKSQNNATNKQSHHVENCLATNHSAFFNFSSLLIVTITYHESKICCIHEHNLEKVLAWTKKTSPCSKSGINKTKIRI